MSIVNTLTIFSDSTCYRSHIVRLVLAEKAIDARILDVAVPANARLMSQFGSTMQAPALAERDLALHEVDMVAEYLEERHPHPALLPTNTTPRANARMLARRIHRELYPLLDAAQAGSIEARKELASTLLELAPLFEQKQFFMSDTLSIADCTLAPLLWRVKSSGINLTKVRGLAGYCERMFSRPAFIASLTEQEQKLA
ncbi:MULTISPECIES: glutathione binding-like protein [Pseudomonas]|uniref:Stringent starvation protein A n=1 Tax=Pseudomonas nitroreducens TaxID=46680 RepID=A0A6G6J892_PSENT|nr:MULTISPECIES: glutathione S-transferase C-terminal domain-containing protein [Pseudomonas]MDU4254032.1 glutathione binding-like protein [Pseudomonas sp.]QIE91605.1 stringent starvation protein A [Pseudomonas nitroreducens]HBO6305194.1 stringent starvation protein A [Pseudomonas aeruginosa]